VDAYRRNQGWSEVAFHVEPQDTTCDAWKRLLDLVEQAAADGREEFAPRRYLDPDDRAMIDLPTRGPRRRRIGIIRLSEPQFVPEDSHPRGHAAVDVVISPPP
jgi:hypothetical protein